MQILEERNLGRYHIHNRLARGGMSSIYLAQDSSNDQIVAIKVVHTDDDHCYQRFQHEIELQSSLKHEHILSLIDYGEENSWSYMVTPYIASGTLARRLVQGPLTLKEAETILLQVTAALQFIHNRDILHLDIKPANILLTEDMHVYLIDFGLAQQINDSTTQQEAETLTGTAEYMSPELFNSSPSHKSDIYSLGVVLYQMLTGSVPFRGSTAIGTYWKHLQEDPRPPSAVNQHLSPAVDAVILRALAKDPTQRFASVSDFAQSYQRAIDPAATLILPLANQIVHTENKIQCRSKRRSYYLHRSSLVAAILLFCLIPLLLGFTSNALFHLATLTEISSAAGPARVSSTELSSGMRRGETPSSIINSSISQTILSARGEVSEIEPSSPALQKWYKQKNKRNIQTKNRPTKQKDE